jgi:hypothetical protein
VTRVFRALHDAQVKSTSPATNYGQLAELRVRAPSPEYRSYTQFVVDGIAGTVLTAKLRMYVTEASDSGGAVHAVANTFRGTSTLWTEDALTWDNAPTIAQAAMDSLGSVDTTSWVEFNVKPAITGHGTYSFALRSGSANSAIYSSDEGAHPPELVLTIQPSSPTGVDDLPVMSWPGLALRGARPNPFRAGTELLVELAAAARVRLTIHDVRGRAVRRLLDAPLAAGAHPARWDGRDDRGAPLPVGVYFARLESPAGIATGKLVLIH